MENHPNPYESLRLPSPPHLPEIDISAPVISEKITDNNAETAVICTRKVSDSLWCAGFQFYWSHGAVSQRMPKPEEGLFRSENDGRLYILGFLSAYNSFFIEDTRRAITRALQKYSQQTLF